MKNDKFLQDIYDKVDVKEVLIELNIIKEFDIDSHLKNVTSFGYDLNIEIENAFYDYKKEIKDVVDKYFNILRENGFYGNSIKSKESKDLIMKNYL